MPILGIVCSFFGIFFVAQIDLEPTIISDGGGFFLGIISCCMYGLFTTLLKVWVMDNVTEVFGKMGLITWIFGIPLVLVCDLFRIEIFSLPTLPAFLGIVVNALIGSVMSDVLLAQAVVLLSPLIVAVGLTLTIPLSVWINVEFFGNTTTGQFDMQYLIGFLLITMSVALISAYKPNNIVFHYV